MVEEKFQDAAMNLFVGILRPYQRELIA